MARRFSNKLVAKQVTAITKPGKHSDGNGLYLLVKPMVIGLGCCS